MIPHKLRLRNFMCYREEQSLDFGGIHLACLTGDNGHGKSALLDAITWALWGRARARRDDELIALGETEMWVEFEFGLGPQRYRVWRQRSKKGRGQSDLHFYIWNPTPGIEPSAGLGVRPADSEEGFRAASTPDDSGDWQLLDDGGLVERQTQIIRTLRLDYETFVNSAFLLQGRADSFTVKTASERKQILADILGLGRYDLYEERAKQEAQARKEQATRIGGEITGIDAELSRRVDYVARLQAARAAAALGAAALHTAEVEQAEARLAVQERRAQARQLADLRGRLTRAERDLIDGRGQLDTAKVRLAQFDAVLAQRAEIEAGWAALCAARAEDAEWNGRLLRHTQTSERVNRARLAVDQARLALEAEERRLSDRQAELGRRVAAGQGQTKALAAAQGILAQMAEQQVRRDAIAAELREIGERTAALRSENDRIKTDGQALNEKVEMLQAADTAACPLCRQPLTADHRDRMLADLAEEHDALADRYRANGGEGKALSERKTALDAEDALLAHDLRARDARQRQAAQAEASVAEGQVAADDMALVAGQRADVASRLAAGNYAPSERAELAEAEAALAEIGYAAAGHEAVRARVQELAPFDARYGRQLLPALDGVADARARVEALAAQLARREAELADDQAEAARLTAAVADLPGLEAALKRAEAAVEGAAATERRARLEEGAALQQIGALTALEERRKLLAADLDRVGEELSVYNQLREAFGKKGLQAMIIESAIPEVEIEANRLLARMSDNRMSLRLETQREKVTGGVAETLDIIISDELGARAYEMFSGGESFRANLALRIAISKLLARRAGAQLQTLVIDEGFGSQDSQGRSLVVEAINSIQHDFERIIVITHIEELKDLFPARIDVVKTASGSRVMVV
jgi:DNA repair protein SbcC/Rad50